MPLVSGSFILCNVKALVGWLHRVRASGIGASGGVSGRRRRAVIALTALAGPLGSTWLTACARDGSALHFQGDLRIFAFEIFRKSSARMRTVPRVRFSLTKSGNRPQNTYGYHPPPHPLLPPFSIFFHGIRRFMSITGNDIYKCERTYRPLCSSPVSCLTCIPSA